MPIYPYRCESCGFEKDHLQKLSDPQISVCPECGSHSYARQLTAAGFQLKGGGWYETDFKGGSSSSASKPAKESLPPCAGGTGACGCANN
ncbi:zinc ribbon domain-containing protein [Rhodocyclus tenuis]|uniref:Zinc ribbon domain-containing protein n=1 Tax=Rhodocyclus gracilis TaxID=2929842 RepID=A0ABX0WIA8_9RHOO|nr:zinc ribbon domain-containing protein [Rhodocyclus gracilis]NJA88188.1 zinc ribbon domain-containing protein [Rhodocyclus gracilis]